MFRPTQYIIKDITDEIIDYDKANNKFCNWQGAGQLMTFFTGKTTNRISAKTTNYAPMGTHPGENWDYQFDWDLPDSKPSGWPQEMWENVNTMMKSGPIGLWADSYSTNFGIYKQYEVFDDADIYALHQDKVYTQVSGSKVNQTHKEFIYKDQQVYNTSDITFKVLKNDSTQIYTSSSTTTLRVVAYKKPDSSTLNGPDTYVKLTANGVDVPGSEGIIGKTAYYIYYNTGGSWKAPGAATDQIPKWVVKGNLDSNLPKRVWLFNYVSNKLYFYKEGKEYTRIRAE